MAETTDFLGLTLPAGSDRVDISVINENFEMLDMQAKTNDAKASAAQDAAGTAQSTAIAAQSAAAENAEEIEALRQNQAALTAGSVTITRNEEFVTGWNAFHNFKDGNTLFINGNFKIGADIPGGTTLFTLPYKVKWAYMQIKHGNNFLYAIANENCIYLENSTEMLKSTSGGATIVGFARITGAADAASEDGS